jgi:hypothetical protein
VSEAIQHRSALPPLDCFVASLLAMTDWDVALALTLALE